MSISFVIKVTNNILDTQISCSMQSMLIFHKEVSQLSFWSTVLFLPFLLARCYGSLFLSCRGSYVSNELTPCKIKSNRSFEMNTQDFWSDSKMKSDLFAEACMVFLPNCRLLYIVCRRKMGNYVADLVVGFGVALLYGICPDSPPIMHCSFGRMCAFVPLGSSVGSCICYR